MKTLRYVRRNSFRSPLIAPFRASLLRFLGLVPLICAIEAHADLWDKIGDAADKVVEKGSEAIQEGMEKGDKAIDEGMEKGLAKGEEVLTGGDKESAVASSSPQGVDPLAPGGVAIGVKGTDAAAALKAAGYETIIAAGANTFFLSAGETRITINVYTGPYHSHSLDGAVSYIDYNARNVPPDTSPVEIVNRMNERIGAQGKCSAVEEQMAACVWESPPASQNIADIRLRVYVPNELNLEVRAR